MARDFRTPTKRAAGLGSAHAGAHHWWMQRLTAGALVILILWFVVSLVGAVGQDYATVTAWIASPAVAVTLVLLISATFYHAALGLQVVIEDYAKGAMRTLGIIAVKAVCILLAVIALFSVLRIAFAPVV